MIKILLTDTGEYLDLAPETEIVWLEVNNVFVFDNVFAVPGSYPFKLPHTAGNAKKLSHVEQPQTHTDVVSLPCRLMVADAFFFDGQLNILQSLRGQFYDVSITINRGTLQPEKMLKDYDFGGDRNIPYGEDGYTQWPELPSVTAGYFYPDRDYTIAPVYEDKDALSFYLNEWNTTTQLHSGLLYPYPYLIYVLKRVLLESNIVAGGRWINDEEIMKLIIFHLKGIGEITSGSPFFTHVGDEALDLANHMPDLNTGQFLNAVKQYFCLGYYFRMNGQPSCRIETLKDMVSSATVNDISGNLCSELETLFESLKGFLLQQTHDTNDSLNELLTEPTLSKLKGTVADVSLLPTAGLSANDLYFVTDENYYYLWNGSTWEKNAFKYFDEQVGTTGDSFAINADTLPHVIIADPNNGAATWKVPNVRYDQDFLYGGKGTPLRLLFYYGMQDNSASDAYPYANHSGELLDMTDCGNYSLLNHGAKGIYEQWYKRFFELMENHKVVQIETTMEASDLQLFKDWEPVRIWNNNYMWMEKQTVFTMTGLKPTRFKLLKL